MLGGFLLAFIWAVRNGQFDDTHSPAVRILFDERKGTVQQKSENEKEK